MVNEAYNALILCLMVVNVPIQDEVVWVVIAYFFIDKDLDHVEITNVLYDVCVIYFVYFFNKNLFSRNTQHLSSPIILLFLYISRDGSS